jgi:hypothetical protein
MDIVIKTVGNAFYLCQKISILNFQRCKRGKSGKSDNVFGMAFFEKAMKL